MNWKWLRLAPWIDSRARFVSSIRSGGHILDLGSSDGGTLRHIKELRPDLMLSSSDIAGKPEFYPPGTDFRAADFDSDKLPWPDQSFDSITCMHVVEHLREPERILSEAARLLRPGGRIYVETPHPKSLQMKSGSGPGAEHVTINFFDDATHIRVVPVDEIAESASRVGLEVIESGISRNWLFASLFPFLYLIRNKSRKRYVAQLHWTGWSAFAIAGRPSTTRWHRR